MQTQKEYKLKSKQIDSIFTSLNFNKSSKIQCDNDWDKQHKTTPLFKGMSLYSLIYNSSKDTILIKNEDHLIVANSLPIDCTTVLTSNGTNLKVFIDEKCMTTYKTQINSCLFYE
jgi:hypothetical protein